MNAKKTDQKYEYLLKLIPTGKEKAVSRRYLANTLQLTERDVSKIIHSARAEGYLILSGHHGYYLPQDVSETKEFYDLMRKRAVSLLSVLKTARKVITEDKESEETK